jgi:glycosyltransferase involved in cell wall biosynthesis
MSIDASPRSTRPNGDVAGRGAPKVALVVSTLDGSGPGRVMSILARALAHRGADCVLVATHGAADRALVTQARAAGVTVTELGMKGMWDVRAVAQLRALIKHWRPDVVHTRTIRADLLGRVAAIDGVPVINNIVNLYPEDCLVRLGPLGGRAIMSLARRTTGAARLFVANARAIAENTRSAFGVPQDRIRVVYDGLELDHWRNATPADLSHAGVSPDDFVCLTVARLHPQKGIEDLVEAARAVVDERPRTRFVVAGDGPDRPVLQRRIEAAGLRDHVLLLGERADVAQLMARADLFVLPSRFEGLPSAVIEAMAAGLAVVATATAGVPELVEEGVTGRLVPPAEPRALARVILEAMSSDLPELGSAASRRADRLFSAPAMTDGFERVYESAVRV